MEKSRFDHNLALGYILTQQKVSAIETLKKLQAGAGHHYKRVQVKLFYLLSIFIFRIVNFTDVHS